MMLSSIYIKFYDGHNLSLLHAVWVLIHATLFVCVLSSITFTVLEEPPVVHTLQRRMHFVTLYQTSLCITYNIPII